MKEEVKNIVPETLKQDACTIFSPIIDYVSIAQILQTEFDMVGFDGERTSWGKISVQSEQCQLILSSLVQVEAGDKFSRLILGSLNFFRRVETKAISNKKFILDFLPQCKMIIGVIVIPEFVDEDKTTDVLFTICEKLDGFIFNGKGMIDSHGKLILDDEGDFDVIR